MGFKIKTNYGPNIEVNKGGVVNLHQNRHGLWATIEAEEAQIVNEVEDRTNKLHKHDGNNEPKCSCTSFIIVVCQYVMKGNSQKHKLHYDDRYQ